MAGTTSSIRITIPGTNTSFSVDANGFATEATLNQLLRAFTGQTGNAQNTAKAQKANVSAINTASGAMYDFAETMDLTTEEIQDNNKAYETLSRRLDNFASLVDQASAATQGLAFSGSDSSGKLRKIADMTGRITEGLAELADSNVVLSFFTKIFAKGADVAAQLAGMAINFMTETLDNLRSYQREIFNSGVFFANGIDDAADLAGQAGTTLGYLSNAAKMASEDLRRSSGGSANALSKVTKAFQLINKNSDPLIKAQIQQLYTLGYTQDEILAGMAKFNADVDMSGRSMSTQELADASMSYLRTMKELDRITGSDLETRKAASEALRNELSYRQFLKTLGDDEQSAVDSLITSIEKVNPEMAKLAKAQVQGVQITDEKMAAIEAQMPGFSNIMRNFRQQLLDGTVATKDVPGIVSEISEVARAEIDSLSNSLGGYQMLNYMEQSSGIMSNILAVLGPAYNNFDKIAKAAEGTKVDEILANYGEDTSRISKAIGTYTEIEVMLSSVMQNVAINMTDSMIWFGEQLAAGFEGIIKLVNPEGESLAEYKKSQEQKRIDDAMDKITSDLLEKSDAVNNKVKGSPEGLHPLFNMSDAEMMRVYKDADTLKQMMELRDKGRELNGLDPIRGKSSGGEVARGETYLVGEDGPEVITAPSPGQAYANDDPIAVKISDTSDFRAMVEKLELLTKLNQAMLRQMERGNTLAQQSSLVAS